MGKAAVQIKIDDFFEKRPSILFKKGDVILSPESNPLGIYFLKEGFVRQYIFTHRGSELTIHFFKPSSFFPLFWAINNLPNKYYYQAFTEVVLKLAPKEQLLEFIKSDPEILYDLSSRLLFGLDGLVTRVESLASSSAKERTWGIILFLAKHFGTKVGDSLTITHHFTHEEIASLTGLTRETTSRELEKLIKQGVIVLKSGFISLPDSSKL